MTDGRTQEQIDAQDALQIAVERHVAAFRSELAQEDIELTGDWILVATIQTLDIENQERKYAYHIALSGGEQPEHVAYGLLQMGGSLIKDGMSE